MSDPSDFKRTRRLDAFHLQINWGSESRGHAKALDERRVNVKSLHIRHDDDTDRQSACNAHYRNNGKASRTSCWKKRRRKEKKTAIQTYTGLYWFIWSKYCLQLSCMLLVAMSDDVHWISSQLRTPITMLLCWI